MARLEGAVGSSIGQHQPKLRWLKVSAYDHEASLIVGMQSTEEPVSKEWTGPQQNS